MSRLLMSIAFNLDAVAELHKVLISCMRTIRPGSFKVLNNQNYHGNQCLETLWTWTHVIYDK